MIRAVPFTVQVLIGLALGLGGGVWLSGATDPWLRSVPSAIEPIGVLFINAIRMTVIPLVVSSLMLGVASAPRAGTVGRIGLRSLGLFVAVLSLAAVFAMAAGLPLFSRLVVDADVAARLRAAAPSALAASTSSAPSFTEWLLALVPTNAFKAAADGAMLPLIVFSIAFGLALGRVKDAARATMLAVFEAVSDASTLMVSWILHLAPLGVFALALPLGTRMGVDAAGALIYYVVVMSAISAAFILVLLVPASTVFGRQSVGSFVRAISPAVAVAFTSRSSLAALPASFDAVRSRLRLPAEIASVYLPLSSAVFRPGGTIAQVLGVLFVAKLYGITLTAPQMGTILVAAVATTFTIPGIPAGAIIVMAPVLTAVGVPVEGMGLLIGVDTIPDMFRTSANVVGWLSGACILGRSPVGLDDKSSANSDA